MLFNNIHVPEQWLGKRFSHAFLINPNWHELRKQEKCSSLAPSRSIFYKPRWAWQGVKSTQLISIFTSKKVWKILIKIQLTKSNQKRTGGWKVPALMPQAEAMSNIRRLQQWITTAEKQLFALISGNLDQSASLLIKIIQNK